MGLLYIDGAYTWRSPHLPSQLFDPIQHHHQFGGLLTYPDHDEAVAVGMDVVIGVQPKRRTRILEEHFPTQNRKGPGRLYAGGDETASAAKE